MGKTFRDEDDWSFDEVKKDSSGLGELKYSKPDFSNASSTEDDTVGSWMLTMLLLSISLFNIFYFFHLATGNSCSESKKNYARASLVYCAIGICLVVILFMLRGCAAITR